MDLDFLFGGQRFVEVKGLKFDKAIFSAIIIFFLLIFFVVMVKNGFDKDVHQYIACKDSVQCYNPLYMQFPVCEKFFYGACTTEYLPSGFVYGTPPPKILEWFTNALLVSIVAGFILNHFMYNREKKYLAED